MDMDIDKVIKRYEDMQTSDCGESSKEYAQLVKWLKELKEYRSLIEQGELINVSCKDDDVSYHKPTNITPKQDLDILKPAQAFHLAYKELQAKVSSDKYLKWFYECVSRDKVIDSESALYEYQGIDSEYGELLNTFFVYIKSGIGDSKDLYIQSNDDFDEKVIIKIDDSFFKLLKITGQGETITYASSLGQYVHGFRCVDMPSLKCYYHV
jgi:hypothetical protein